MRCSTASPCARATTPACRCSRPITRIFRRTRRCTRPTARSASAKSTSSVRSSGAWSSITLRDFHLAGVGLDAERKQRFKNVLLELTQLQSKFEENVLDATNAWSYHITDASQLAGLNESIVEQGRTARPRRAPRGLGAHPRPADLCRGGDGCRVAPNCAVRSTKRGRTRASDQGPSAGRWDNSQVMEDILRAPARGGAAARFQELCRIRARDPHGAQRRGGHEFLEELAQQGTRRRARARSRSSQHSPASRSKPGTSASMPSACSAASYAVSQEELRPYFCLPRVLDRPLRASPSACLTFASARATASSCGTRTCASSRSSDAPVMRSAASTSMPTRAPTREAAPGWTSASGRKHMSGRFDSAGRLSRVQLPAAERRRIRRF